MIGYYGYTISRNQLETGEGFLICRNVPIARIGTMEYLESELGMEGNSIVKVCRSPEEVFSEAALSSFEGKPVTDEHPPELVTPETAALYLKGHSQNIRKGTGEWDGYVIADLHIHDEGLIREIQSGKREVSCGYECEYIKNEDGTYSQHKIRGNHVAIVERGRAGKKAAILDSDKKVQAKKPERKKMKKNSLFFKLFGQAVKDASPEELDQLAEDAAEALEGGELKPKKEEKTAEAKDNGINMDELVQKVVDAMKAQRQNKTEDKDPLDKAIDELGTETAEDDEAKVVAAEADDGGEETTTGMDRAIAVGLLKQMRPVVAAIKDPAERKAVTDSLLAYISSPGQESDISKIMKVTQKNAQKVADSKPTLDLDAVQSAYDKFNPHKQNGGTN